MFNCLCLGTIFAFLCLGHQRRISFLVHEKSKSSFKVKSNQVLRHFLRSSMFKKQKISLLNTMFRLVSGLKTVRPPFLPKPRTQDENLSLMIFFRRKVPKTLATNIKYGQKDQEHKLGWKFKSERQSPNNNLFRWP